MYQIARQTAFLGVSFCLNPFGFKVVLGKAARAQVTKLEGLHLKGGVSLSNRDLEEKISLSI